ncbi:hypothetical protein [Eubacterium limosum]|uniref:Uncharacterized protein n=1 Tax=Eubacterium limosum TaxID=1736 RepID=A0AAC9QW58_EUBLI|nr:hypothetical protein [Eubacterium limosum]ARD66819.1 hypothetical protein B2M23_15375 [Eubacterium limosum]PWW55155.1 hypothetical protein C7955_104194 [Eubacterium limosum]UQZ22801.1 hypothetical protein M5595_00840 [Eubacterium limosum]
MNDGKDFFRMLLSFGLVFVLLGLQLVLFTDKVIFNPRTYEPYYTRDDYFGRMAAESDNKLEIIARYNNVPQEILQAPVDEAFLKSYARQCTEHLIAYLRGESREYKPSFDRTALQSSVEHYVAQHLAESGLSYDENAAAQVTSIVDASVDALNNTVMILNPDLLTQFGVAGMIRRGFGLAGSLELGLALAALVLTALLALLNWKHFMRTLWWAGSSLAISSGVLMIVGIFLTAINLPGRLGAADSYIRFLAETGIAGILRSFCLWQLGAILLAGAMMEAYAFHRQRKFMLARAGRLRHQLAREDPTTGKIGPVSLMEIDEAEVLTPEDIEALVRQETGSENSPARQSPRDRSFYAVDIRRKWIFTPAEIRPLIARNRRKDLVFTAEAYTITYPRGTLSLPRDCPEVSLALDWELQARSRADTRGFGDSGSAAVLRISGAERLPGAGIIRLRLDGAPVSRVP